MNMILNTDSYKASQYLQLPPNMRYQFSYVESRGSAGDHNTYDRDDMPVIITQTVFFGLQKYLIDVLSEPITQADIDEADEILTAHGEPFNREGWQYILRKYNGYMPVRIRAVPEGTVVETRNALVTVENTDPNCAWLVSYLETALMRAVWYPTTVATVSWRIKNLIKLYMEETSDTTEGLEFKLHDFGARGVSSDESAGIGGLAHLVNFMGTDTVSALLAGRKYYNEPMAGFSIPASEHSSMTTWGREREVDAYRNMLTQFAQPGKMLAVVSDSYNIYNAASKIWGGVLKQEVIDSGATVIIRPDSGDPASTVLRVMSALGASFGTVLNSKGYKVVNHIRVIQGDGIDEKSIRLILSSMKLNKWSTDNIAFGMGGALLQHMNRDTLKFAMKASAAYIDDKWQDVWKDPVGDKGKASKRGKFTLIKNTETGEVYTGNKNGHPYLEDMMRTVYCNGELVNKTTLAEVRANVSM